MLSSQMVIVYTILCFCNPMDCRPPGSSVFEILQARILGSYSLLQRIFLTQGSNRGLLHCRQILCHLSYQEINHHYLIREHFYLPLQEMPSPFPCFQPPDSQ